MKNKIEYIILGIIVCVFSFSVMSLNSILKENTATTSTAVLDNKTIGWGIKRATNNMQPDVGANNKQLLEKNDGICLGKDTEKSLYLTFDEGYEAGYTEKILDTLKQNEVKATFFITSHYLNTASELVERMINEGHIVGNHTVNHPSLPSKADEEI